MINKTKNYDMFIFRDDNRAKIDHAHVERLANSIKSKNLLELRPVVVNKKMQVLDGQHRILAAKSLGVDIYYIIEKDLDGKDVIALNVSKQWGLQDYLNYYVKNGYEEYIKLDKFIKKNNINIRVAFNLTYGGSKEDVRSFIEGNYVFSADVTDTIFQICWQSIALIKKLNGYSMYTNSTRFWKAIIKLTRHPDFDEKKWFFNLDRLSNRCSAKAKETDYLKIFVEIYNWHNPLKIEF